MEFGIIESISLSTSINFRLLFIGSNKDMSRKMGNEKDAEGEKGIRWYLLKVDKMGNI